MSRVPVLAAVALGGAVGSVLRHGISVGWPTPPAGFAWSTFLVNVLGCAAIGILMVLLTELPTTGQAPRLARPFLGIGVLGGFTTFSTHVLDAWNLIAHGRGVLAAVYTGGTVVTALLAVLLAIVGTRVLVRSRLREAAR